MLSLISPAKTLDFNGINLNPYSIPQMLGETLELVKELRKYNISEIQSLMKVSPNIATLNFQRFIDFQDSFNQNNAKQAIFAFRGDVYTNLNIDSFGAKDIDFANNSVRILSGLYGVLKPLDLIQPYRLEMGTRLPINKHKNLYQFWGTKISNNLNSYKEEYIINLASNEYFKAVDKNTINAKIIDINFKENKNGTYKTIGVYAKKARGKMINFIIKNQVNNPNNLKEFNIDNYCFNQKLSSETQWIFTR